MKNITNEIKKAIESGVELYLTEDGVIVRGESPNGNICDLQFADWHADDWSDAVPVGLSDEEIETIKSELPDDLTFDRFSRGFASPHWNGNVYLYGAWNSAGEWVLAFNTVAEFRAQLAQL